MAIKQSPDEFMAALNYPLKAEAEVLRTIIKEAAPKLSEQIKWAAPSYFYKHDLVTFNFKDLKQIRLVFHHKAVVSIKSDLLKGEYVDRRIAFFKNMQEVKENEAELRRVIILLVNAMDEITN